MKEFIKALYALFAFRPYTSFYRWFEIGCGISAWCNLGIIAYAIYKSMQWSL